MTKFIFYLELGLEEGLAIVGAKRSRVGDLVFNRPSGWRLFKREGIGATCFQCGCTADRWIVMQGRKDLKGSPIMNLYAMKHGVLTMLTRDHIIPAALGGSDSVDNMRVACSTCNEKRGTKISPQDKVFMDAHPELINRARKHRRDVRATAHERRLRWRETRDKKFKENTCT